jgi:hypothetical protein
MYGTCECNMGDHFLLLFIVQLLLSIGAADPIVNLSLTSPQVVPIITNSTVEQNFASIKSALEAPIFTPDDLEVRLNNLSKPLLNSFR